MAELKGVDIAWDRPTIPAIKATGAHWVARYFSTDVTKNLTAAEVHDYPANGLAVVTVFESTAGRATQGRAAGIADARLAEQQRAAVGLPASHVHHFAVDEDTTWASVQAYFDGAASVIGLGRTGTYGGLHVIEGAHGYGIDYLWQTTAWSGGVWSAHATIRQTGGTLLAGAADIDYAEVPDFGQFPRPVTPKPVPPPAPAPKPVPAPVPNPHLKEIDMIMLSIAKTDVPAGATWPGDLLYAGGKLSHIFAAADEAAFRAAGIPGPVRITWGQYQALLAAK